LFLLLQFDYFLLCFHLLFLLKRELWISFSRIRHYSSLKTDVISTLIRFRFTADVISTLLISFRFTGDVISTLLIRFRFTGDVISTLLIRFRFTWDVISTLLIRFRFTCRDVISTLLIRFRFTGYRIGHTPLFIMKDNFK